MSRRLLKTNKSEFQIQSMENKGCTSHLLDSITSQATKVIEELGPKSLDPTGLDQESSDSRVDETNLLIGRILKKNLDFGSTANFWSKSRAGKSNETSDRHRSLGNDCLKTGHFKGAIDEYNKV